jgi:hypothetical protein
MHVDVCSCLALYPRSSSGLNTHFFESDSCMEKSTLFSLPTYDPDRLLDELKDRLQVTTDAQLALALGMQAPVISKLRHRVAPVSAFILIQMHEATQLSIKELRYLMGDESSRFSAWKVPAPVRKRDWRIAPTRGTPAHAANNCKDAN